MDMGFAENIRKLRLAKGWTLMELAGRAGLDSGNLSKMERGLYGYSRESVESLAAAFGVTQAALFDDESNVDPAAIGARRVPVIDYVQAGVWTGVLEGKSDSDVLECILTDQELSSSAFAMRIRGDSMQPVFDEGDVVIIDPEVEPRPGDFVCAANGSGEAVFKQYRVRGYTDTGKEIFELVPLNELYPTLRSDVQHIRVVGTMLEHRRFRRR